MPSKLDGTAGPAGRERAELLALPSGLRMFDLRGVVTIVTGASQGLGRQMAVAVGRAGASVMLAARRAPELERAVAEIEGEGGDAASCAADLTDASQVEKVIAATVARFGHIDVLVNNAGISPKVGSPLSYSREEWDLIFDVNAKATYFCAQSVARWMIDNGRPGSIVNIASTAATGAISGVSVYAASKAATLQMTRSLAFELAEHGIRVNAICPGTFESETTADLSKRRGRYYEHLLSRIPLARFGRARDLDGAIVFLASPASGYLTGAVVHVDGGWSTL